MLVLVLVSMSLLASLPAVQARGTYRRVDRTDVDWSDEVSRDPYWRMIESLLKKYKQKMSKFESLPIGALGPFVWVGPSAPSVDYLDPLAESSGDDFNQKNYSFHLPHPHHIDFPLHLKHRLERSKDELSEEICKTNRYWKQINETKDKDGHDVLIVHTKHYRQFTYVYECVAENHSCTDTSDQVRSICEMRFGWANMLHFKKPKKDDVEQDFDLDQAPTPQWGYVAVPHHCGCRIYQRTPPLA